MNKLKKNDLFCVTFLGEFVEIMTKVRINSMPLLIHGYLLDLDDDYYYIGDNSIEVNASIKKDSVIGIQIGRKVDETTEYLQNLPNPTSEGEIN